MGAWRCLNLASRSGVALSIEGIAGSVTLNSSVGAGLSSKSALREAHRRQPPGEWIRAIGYHESVAGDLDRRTLDAVVADRPVRVQHRSGAMWVVNSAAATAVGLDPSHDGRLFRMDGWLRDRVPSDGRLDLGAVARQLAGYGITGVTDATPFEDAGGFGLLAGAGLPLDVVVTGGPALAAASVPEPLGRGPVKIVVPDHEPMPFDDLTGAIQTAHRADRPVAVHCVTRVSLALLVAAFDQTGTRLGDRVEHGAVVPPDLAQRLAESGVTVVTQPSFVRERGDQYLDEVDADDRRWLYPCRSLLAAGVPVGGSSDAPFANADPWPAIATAANRRTAAGRVLGQEETVSAERALALYLSAPEQPGGPSRRLAVGGPADLCLLDRPLADALAEPSADHVVMTIRAGQVTHQ